MTAKFYRPITIQQITWTDDGAGGETPQVGTSITPVAEIHDVSDSIRYNERFRNYPNLVKFSVYWTQALDDVYQNPLNYQAVYQGTVWRIESSNRQGTQRLSFMIYQDQRNQRV